MGFPRIRFLQNVELQITKDGKAKDQIYISSINYAVHKVVIHRDTNQQDKYADIYFDDGSVAKGVEMDGSFEIHERPKIEYVTIKEDKSGKQSTANTSGTGTVQGKS